MWSRLIIRKDDLLYQVLTFLQSIKKSKISAIKQDLWDLNSGNLNSGSWWWTGRPGVLWFMGSQRVGHDWATELNWTELNLLPESRLQTKTLSRCVYVDAQMAQTKPCAHEETSQRLSQTCLWVFEWILRRYVSAVACHRGRGSGCSRPGCGISPLGGDCH